MSVINNFFQSEGSNRFQIKPLSASLTSSTDPIASLSFSNLVIGKIYRLTAKLSVQSTLSGSGGTLIFDHDGSDILNSSIQLAASSGAKFSDTTIFVATATSIGCRWSEIGTAELFGGTPSNSTLSYAILEELNNYSSIDGF